MSTFVPSKTTRAIVDSVTSEKRRIDAMCDVLGRAGPGYLYALRDSTGAVKVGRAKNPVTRCLSVQALNSRPLELIGLAHLADLERLAHSSLADAHLHGEWFETSENPLPTIDGVCWCCNLVRSGAIVRILGDRGPWMKSTHPSIVAQRRPDIPSKDPTPVLDHDTGEVARVCDGHLSPAELATTMGLGLSAVYRWVSLGCPHARVGRRGIMLDQGAVRAWLTERAGITAVLRPELNLSEVLS